MRLLRFFIISVFLLPISLQASILLEHSKIELKYSNKINKNDYLIPTGKLTISPEEIKYKNQVVYHRIETAINIIKYVLNSEQFKTKILKYERPSNRKNEFSRNYLWKKKQNPLSNAEIYELIMKGNEKTIPNTISQMNLFVKSYKSSYRKRKVIGYTKPRTSQWIKVNTRHYNSSSIPKIAANLVHEWVHLLGFLHGKKNKKEEVPYVVGAIVYQMTKEYLKNNDLPLR